MFLSKSDDTPFYLLPFLIKKVKVNVSLFFKVILKLTEILIGSMIIYVALVTFKFSKMSLY